jgi:hypothetical protein
MRTDASLSGYATVRSPLTPPTLPAAAHLDQSRCYARG